MDVLSKRVLIGSTDAGVFPSTQIVVPVSVDCCSYRSEILEISGLWRHVAPKTAALFRKSNHRN
jgi:hypothetical protein